MNLSELVNFTSLEIINLINSLKRQSYRHIETSQLICRANQLTGFYMMATLAFNELIRLILEKKLEPVM